MDNYFVLNKAIVIAKLDVRQSVHGLIVVDLYHAQFQFLRKPQLFMLKLLTLIVTVTAITQDHSELPNPLLTLRIP